MIYIVLKCWKFKFVNLPFWKKIFFFKESMKHQFLSILYVWGEFFWFQQFCRRFDLHSYSLQVSNPYGKSRGLQMRNRIMVVYTRRGNIWRFVNINFIKCWLVLFYNFSFIICIIINFSVLKKKKMPKWNIKENETK